MDRIGSLLIDWLAGGCCSTLESCVGHVGWLFGSLFRLVVDGIVVVLVSCLLGGLKVMNGVRLFWVFVLADGELTYRLLVCPLLLWWPARSRLVDTVV